MKIPFPQSNKAYVQNNRSNVFPKGNLWSTLGMDFQSNLGVARVAPRLRINSQVSDLANLGVPVAFKYFDGKFRTVAGARVFNGGDTPNAVFTQDAAAGTPTTCSSDTADMEVFNGKLYVTTQTSLVVNGSAGGFTTWSNVDAGLTTGLPHIIRYLPKYNRLYYTNGTSIRSINTAGTVASAGDYFLDLPFGNLITSMEVTADAIWVGTQSRDVADMNGNIFRWDGISAQADDVYPVQGKGVYAIAINDDTGLPHVMDSAGILSAFNGSGFAEVGRLPYTNILPHNDDGFVSNKFIHPNGLIYTENDTFLAFINNLNSDNSGTINENLPSGGWEWSGEGNFTHKYPFTYNAGGSITDFGQNRILRAGAVFNANKPSTTSGRFGTILVGAAIYTDATTTTNAIFVDDSLNEMQKRGYMVSTWFESDEIADSWDSWWVSYRRFLDLYDNITVKYRNVEEAPVEGTITWVNTTSFTILNSAVDVSQYWTSGTGGEVEILRGTGGGSCVHITNAVNNAGTWTVTIDEVVTGVTTGTATARFQKWIKLFPTEALTTPRNWGQFAFDTNSEPRIQVKVCFTYTGVGEFYKAILTSNENIKTK